MNDKTKPGISIAPATPNWVPDLWPGQAPSPWELPRAFPGALPGPAFPTPKTAPAPRQNPFIDFFNRSNKPETAPMNRTLPANIQALLARPVSYFKENPSEADTGKAPLTNVAFVLDCSTSMSDGKDATVEGFNTQVAVVRDGAKLAGATTFTDVHFSTGVELRCVAGSLDELKPLTTETYRTSGWTALYDALGATIAGLLSTEGINSPNTAMLVTVFTDGEENRSTLYDGATLKALIERLEATGRWTFALVGPLQSVTGLAQLLSVKQKNIAGFDVGSVEDKRKAFSKVAVASASYMSMRSMGATQSTNLYDDKDLQG